VSRTEDTLDCLPPAELSRVAGAEPLPGYRLVEILGTGSFGEIWKCEVPGGLFKAIKFVHGNLNTVGGESLQAEQELEAYQRIKAIRHPFLLSTERVEIVAGELMIVMELADRNLEEVLREYQAGGSPGIPRAQLLGFLREAAEALDLINQQHGLQHLDVKPRNLVLVSNHVKVADFGLVSRLPADSGNTVPHPGGVTPYYASPEALQGKISPHSDQYSLAIVYQELLTGTLPFKGKNTRQIMMQHFLGKPNLAPLPAEDRPAVARALAQQPDQRFVSCLDFVQALLCASGSGTHSISGTMNLTRLPPLRKSLSGTYLHRRADLAGKLKIDEEGKAQPNAACGQTPTAAARGEACPPMPAYKFLDTINQGPLGEQWKVRAPGGDMLLAQFLPGFATSDERAAGELAACLRELHHPALLPAELYRNTAGQLVLVTDLFEQTLRGRYQQCVAQGFPGIPRLELIGHLAATAEALDDLYQRHRLRHLNLNPRTVAIRGARTVLLEFGLTELVWLPTGQPAAVVNARYAAPELTQKSDSPASDQYSLALIYAELLTGVYPRPSRSGARPGLESASRPDVGRLPVTDREAVARALHPEPQRRYPSCSEFVRALKGATVASPVADCLTVGLPAVIPFASLFGEPPSPSTILPTLEQLVTQQINAGAEGVESRQYQSFEYTVAATGTIEHRFPIRAIPGAMRLKLDGFRQQWRAHVARQDDQTVVYYLQAPRRLWQRCVGKHEGLEVCVSLPTGQGTDTRFSEATVQVQAFGGERGGQMLAEMGSTVLESVRSFLQASPERRRQTRWTCLPPLRVYAVFPDLELAEPSAGMGKNLSRNGIGILLPQPPATRDLYVHLYAAPHLAPWALLAHVVRVQAIEEGWYEIGATFEGAG
jgi:serine/threonine protein kinase